MFLAVTIRNVVARFLLSRMVSLVICSAVASVTKIKSNNMLWTWKHITEPHEKEVESNGHGSGTACLFGFRNGSDRQRTTSSQ